MKQKPGWHFWIECEGIGCNEAFLGIVPGHGTDSRKASVQLAIKNGWTLLDGNIMECKTCTQSRVEIVRNPLVKKGSNIII